MKIEETPANKAFLLEVGQRVRKAREVRQLTQEELGLQCGYSPDCARSAISHIESGKRDIAISKINVLATTLNVTPNYLLGINPNSSESDKPTPKQEEEQTGNYLKNRRIELGLTQTEVADYIGVKGATISRWESGNIKNMGRDKIAKYAEILRTSQAFIMNGEEDKADSINDRLISAFNSAPDNVRKAILTLLGVEE